MPNLTSACRLACLFACRFVAFFSVAFVAYHMRTRHGYRSLPEAIHARYGGLAAIAFGLAVAYR
jgi:Na+/proline symporter